MRRKRDRRLRLDAALALAGSAVAIFVIGIAVVRIGGVHEAELASPPAGISASPPTGVSASPTRQVGSPEGEPSDIFADVHGWIAYRNTSYECSLCFGTGIFAKDPARPGSEEVQLSHRTGEPLAWSRDGSKLLVRLVTEEGRPREGLFMLNADGTETNLVNHTFVAAASLSADGSKIVYSPAQRSSGGTGIYVVDVEDAAPRRLLAGGKGRWYTPAISPDGKQIAYAVSNGLNERSLWVMDAHGGNRHLLVRDVGQGLMSFPLARRIRITHLVWSPDGTRLAFDVRHSHRLEPNSERFVTDSDIYVVDADGTELHLAIRSGSNPHWSPDGARISFAIGRAPQTWMSPGGACQRVPRKGTVAIGDPDGVHVLWLGVGTSGPWNPLPRRETEHAPPTAGRSSSVKVPVGTLEDAQGWIVYRSGVRLIAVDPSHTNHMVSLGCFAHLDPIAADGSYLLLESRGYGALWTLNAGGSLVRLTGSATTGGSFHPNGEQVVFAEGARLLVSDPSGERRRTIVSHGPRTEIEEAVWAPDGSRIAFITSKPVDVDCVDFGCEYRSRILWIANADGTGRRVLKDLGRAGFGETSVLTWSPDGSQLAFDKGHDLYVISADGVGERRVMGPGRDQHPAWSPDGSRIAFLCDRDLCIVNADGTRERSLTEGGRFGGALRYLDQPPVWSPDGSRIAFLCVRSLCIVNTHRGSVRVADRIPPSTETLIAWNPIT